MCCARLTSAGPSGRILSSISAKRLSRSSRTSAGCRCGWEIPACGHASENRLGGVLLAPLRLRAGAQIPVKDLLAGPEFDVGLSADHVEHAAEMFQPVRRPHDVRV